MGPSSRLSTGRRGGNRYDKGKCTAFVFSLTFGPDAAAVQFNQLSCQREPQTGSLVTTAGRVVHLFKRSENALQVLAVNADAGVRDLHLDRIGAVGRFGAISFGCRNIYLSAFRRKFHRIGEQVTLDLLELAFIADDLFRDPVRINGNPDAVFQGLFFYHRHAVFQQVLDVHRCQLQLAGLDLGQIQDIVNKLKQVTAAQQNIVQAKR